VSSRDRDTVYDRNAPGQQRLGYSGAGFSSNEERLVSEALMAQQDIDPELLRQVSSPPPERLFPPRFVGERTQPGIQDVVQVDRRYPDSSAQFSGTSGGYSGTSVPSIGWW